MSVKPAGSRASGEPSSALISASAWSNRSLASRMKMIEAARDAARESDIGALERLLGEGLRVENYALLLFAAGYASSSFFERLIKAWPKDALPLSDPDGFGYRALKCCVGPLSASGSAQPKGESLADGVFNKLLALKRVGVAYDSDEGAQVIGRELASSAEVSEEIWARLKPLGLRLDLPCSEDGLTPLALCVRAGYLRRAQALVALGADPKTARLDQPGAYEGRSPLGAAIRLRQWDKVRLYLSWGADPKKAEIDQLSFSKETALSSCLKEGDFQGVRLLMELGANPRAKGPDWERCLLLAGRQRDAERGLLEFKALVEARDLGKAAKKAKRQPGAAPGSVKPRL